MKHQFLITVNSCPTKQDVFLFKKFEDGKKIMFKKYLVIN
jgi:hypothetical protein